MILHGDCLDVLQDLPAAQYDALITDPPAGIAFMGKHWDKDKGGRDEWVKWMTTVMQECHRVLKPGAHGFVWALPRTSHWTATALENAGFEIRDVVMHLFGSGFPKSLDISKAIDKAAGAKREVLGKYQHPDGSGNRSAKSLKTINTATPRKEGGEWNYDLTAPATPDAKHWQGWGTALKPASEHWILIRKPLEEKTVAGNVLKHGTGSINVDGCRIGAPPAPRNAPKPKFNGGNFHAGQKREVVEMHHFNPTQGRFPANVVLSHNPDCVEVGEKRVKAITGGGMNRDGQGLNNTYSRHQGHQRVRTVTKGNPDGTETVPAYECTEGCAVAALDEQSGVLKSGKLNGSRFFYTAKASKSERGADNNHPTVKPLKLMRYLIRMITPPGGTVIDPFTGSGSTGVAALEEGFEFLGIEAEKEYVEIAQRRLDHASEEPRFKLKERKYG